MEDKYLAYAIQAAALDGMSDDKVNSWSEVEGCEKWDVDDLRYNILRYQEIIKFHNEYASMKGMFSDVDDIKHNVEQEELTKLLGEPTVSYADMVKALAYPRKLWRVLATPLKRK